MKIFTQSVYILCRNHEDLCSCFWIYFYVLANVWLLLGVFQCFLKNGTASEKISMNDCFWKKMCGWYFFCVWLLLETFQCFLMNVRLLLKRYLTTASERKKMCFLEIITMFPSYRIVIAPFQFSYRIGLLFPLAQIFCGMIFVTERGRNALILKVIRGVSDSYRSAPKTKWKHIWSDNWVWFWV